MEIVKLVSSGVLIVLAAATSLTADGWRGIAPLHATRLDVERLLGPSTVRCRCEYSLDNEKVFVQYSGDTCEQDGAGGWNVPRDTVISISVYFRDQPRFSDLQVDTTKFKKTEEPELKGYVTYTDEDSGVSYEVSDKGIVQGVRYFPAAKDKNLRCPTPYN